MGTDVSKQRIVFTLTATQSEKNEEDMFFSKLCIIIYRSKRHNISEELLFNKMAVRTLNVANKLLLTNCC
jgi:hypothetical protein